MRLAAIDCGTNTAMLLVADVVEGGIPRLRPVADVLEMPRLGQDLDRTRRLHPDAIARTLAAIARQVERARALKVDRLIVVGTESLRAAENSDDFLTALLATGIELRVISGDEEARLSWRSVAESLPLPASGRRSVLDIGGGSTELVVGGGGERPERWASVKIGSVRLHERCIRHDPPTREEVAALLAAIDAGLDKLPTPEGELVALAGTATTVAALHLGMVDYDGRKVDGLRLGTDRLREIILDLGRRSIAERGQLLGLDPRRADVIFAGAMILLRTAERAGTTEVVISDRGVRWGVLEELADEKSRTNAGGQG
jgi:exopolyphosphatase/guanosine-5'-triphosphate,3'-diphosphate pyrophosphatase